MRGRVAWWGNSGDGFAVEFDQEMLSWLDGQDSDRRVFVLVDRERQVIVLPDRDGGRVTTRVTGDGPRHSRPQVVFTSGHKPSSFACTLDMAAFGLTEVPFREEEGCLTADLPWDHELAWPNVRPDATTYEAPLLLRTVLQARLISLVASGETTFRPEHRMPMRLRRMLPDGAWADCLATAKALASGGCYA